MAATSSTATRRTHEGPGLRRLPLFDVCSDCNESHPDCVAVRRGDRLAVLCQRCDDRNELPTGPAAFWTMEAYS